MVSLRYWMPLSFSLPGKGEKREVFCEHEERLLLCQDKCCSREQKLCNHHSGHESKASPSAIWKMQEPWCPPSLPQVCSELRPDTEYEKYYLGAYVRQWYPCFLGLLSSIAYPSCCCPVYFSFCFKNEKKKKEALKVAKVRMEEPSCL